MTGVATKATTDGGEQTRRPPVVVPRVAPAVTAVATGARPRAGAPNDPLLSVSVCHTHRPMAAAGAKAVRGVGTDHAQYLVPAETRDPVTAEVVVAVTTAVLRLDRNRGQDPPSSGQKAQASRRSRPESSHTTGTCHILLLPLLLRRASETTGLDP